MVLDKLEAGCQPGRVQWSCCTTGPVGRRCLTHASRSKAGLVVHCLLQRKAALQEGTFAVVDLALQLIVVADSTADGLVGPLQCAVHLLALVAHRGQVALQLRLLKVQLLMLAGRVAGSLAGALQS